MSSVASSLDLVELCMKITFVDEVAIEQRRHFDKILVDAKNEIQNQQDQLKKLTERNEALTTSLSREVEGVKSVSTFLVCL